MANLGVRIPNHSVISRLGRGGMASVYLARHDQLGRLVAVKVIDDRFDDDPQFRQRFEREARTAAGLTHPNIVPVHEYGFTEDGRPFLSMAFIDGGSLRERLRMRGPSPVDQALAILRQIASALLVAHSRHIVHRDLKPDNVLFQNDTALLTDFGIAKVLDASTELTGTGATPGTVKYFSPEQAKEQPVDQRSDIYALGVMFYEMLTGVLPIVGDTAMQIILGIAHKPPDPLPRAFAGLQPFLDVLLAKDPNDRLGSCADVIAIVQAMERNWLRFGDVDKITEGVDLSTSSRRDAPTDGELVPTLIQSRPGLGQPSNAPFPARADDGAGLTLSTSPTAAQRALGDGPARTAPTQPFTRTPEAFANSPQAFTNTPQAFANTPQALFDSAPASSPGTARTDPLARSSVQIGERRISGPIALAAAGAVLVAVALLTYLLTRPESSAVPTTVANVRSAAVAETSTSAVAADVTTTAPPGPMQLPTDGLAKTLSETRPPPSEQRVSEPPPAVASTPPARTPVKTGSATASFNPPPRSEERPPPRRQDPPAAAPPQPAITSTADSRLPPLPEDLLYGTWQYDGTEAGRSRTIIWRATRDGRSRYLINPGSPDVEAFEASFVYAEGRLNESLANGSSRVAELRMVDRHQVDVRIVEGGRGITRRFKRQ